MHWLSYLHGGMPDDGNFGGCRWQVRDRPDKVRFLRNMRIGMSGFGDCPRTMKVKQQIRGQSPLFCCNLTRKI